MKYFIYFAAYIYLKLNIDASLLVHGNIEDYLSNKMKSLSVEEAVRLKRNTTNSYQILNYDYHDNLGRWRFAYPFRAFNESYIMLDGNLHELFHGKYINTCSAEFCLAFLSIIDDPKRITKVEVIQFGKFAIMYVVLNRKFLRIIKFDRSIRNEINIQTIEHPHIADVRFFLNQQKLYLIVCNERGNNVLPIVLYQWMDDHFDEQLTLFDKGIKQIETFESENVQIILMSQKKMNKTFCILYEFDNNTLTKRDVIRVDGPIFTIPYRTNDEQYVLFAGNHTQSIYRWTGFDLEEWSVQKVNNSYEKMFTIHVNNTSLIFGSNLETLVAYKPTTEGIEVVAEKLYKHNFTQIFNIEHIKENGTDLIIAVGNMDYGKAGLIEGLLVLSSPESTKEKLPILLEDPLHECFATMNVKLETDDIDSTTKRKPIPSIQEGARKALPSYSLKSRVNEIKDLELDDKFSEIQDKFSSVESSISKLEDGLENMVINGQIKIEGTLTADKIQANYTSLKTVNNKKWAPNQWLSYTKNQTISGGINANILRVKDMITTTEVNLFDDLLLNNTNVKLAGDTKIGNLTSHVIFVDEINNIEMSAVFMKGRDLIAGGVKTLAQITANSVEASYIHNEESPKFLDKIFARTKQNSIKFAPHVFIDDLEVDDIDNVNWNTFKHSVFRNGISKGITGNLRLRSFEAENLEVLSLNGENVEEYLTATTDQTVDSVIKFNTIYTSNITAKSINGLNLGESVAIVQNPSINSPVSLNDIDIRGNLIQEYTLDNASIPNEDQHIIGTQISDLLQLYTGVIKIVGNLKVKNLKMSPNSSVLVGEEKKLFNPRVEEKYWMKQRNQVIRVHLEAQEGITTPHLQTMLLNGNGMFNYLFNNTNKTLPATYSFENATFEKNLFLNDQKSHIPNLQKIDEESVKMNGTFVVKGQKTFKNLLKINNLVADNLNDMDLTKLVTKNNPIVFSGSKIFQNLIINGGFETKNYSCQILNGVDVVKFQEEAVYIDRSQELDGNFRFSRVFVENLNVQTLNDRPVGEYITQANDMFSSNVIDSLIINGNLSIGNLLNLSKINEKDPDVLHRNKLKLDGHGKLHGHIRFAGNVTIDNLSATVINNINFKNLTKRLFYKSSNQLIPNKFVFKNLKTGNLIAPKINNVTVFPIIDVESANTQELIIPRGIQFSDINLANLIGDNIFPCNIDKAMAAMRNPPTQNWSKMKIVGNVTILDEENSLYEILENVVITNSHNQIKASVQFSDIMVDNLESFQHINTINLSDIFLDALLRETDIEQIVTGENTFERIAVYAATVGNNSDIPVVGDLEISKIARKMIIRDEVNHIPIRGKKTFFAGLQTEKVQTQTVSSVIPENLVTITDQKVIPSATFEDVQINKYLTIDRINDYNFNHFLRERLLLAGPTPQEVTGTYFFNDVHIAGNVTASFINGININDVIFDIGTQEIQGKKTFVNDVYVNGNIEILLLNGHLISDMYHKTLLRNEEGYIKANVDIVSPSVVNGTIITDFINGYALEKITNSLDIKASQKFVKKVGDLIIAIEKSTRKTAQLVERIPSEIMYIEKEKVIDMSFPKNIREATAFRLMDHVVIQIIGDQDGYMCGLPKECNCPVQYTVQISPENSINAIEHKGSQRVYLYRDDIMIVHLITDSISTDMICRSNNTKNENSTLAWSTISSNNITGKMKSLPLGFTGYVSSVEYFTINNITYVIIGRYFDPKKNSYDLDCIVFKFNTDRSTVTEIQRINTNGVWSLKVFYSAQGLNLIIGMLGDGHPVHNLEKTLFMRFDQDQEKFFLLREVQAYGCSASAGIVMETDSFITLSHKIYPILIFKYDQHIDNYVYYQNLWDPLPIKGISVFYSKGVGISDPHLCVVSERETYSIYAYKYIEGWQRMFYGEIKGLGYLVPFEMNKKSYLFAPSSNVSSILNVVMFGSD